MARYSCQMDWLSFVLPIYTVGEGSTQAYLAAAVERTILHKVPERMADDLFSKIQPMGFGRSPYAEGWSDNSKGVTIWAGYEIPHITVEFSGRGMAYLRERGWEQEILAGVADNISRLDVAIDLEQGIQPEEFLKYRKGGRQSSNARFDSTSGQTCYVGSRHSERYMRVYRYASPHPRSHLLRIETVFKRAYAKQAGNQILEVGLDAVAKTTMEYFGFSDLIDFEENTPEADMSVYRPERNGGKTLRWIIKQVAPAFHRLVKEGVIPNARQFCETYFLLPLEED